MFSRPIGSLLHLQISKKCRSRVSRSLCILSGPRTMQVTFAPSSRMMPQGSSIPRSGEMVPHGSNSSLINGQLWWRSVKPKELHSLAWISLLCLLPHVSLPFPSSLLLFPTVSVRLSLSLSIRLSKFLKSSVDKCLLTSLC